MKPIEETWRVGRKVVEKWDAELNRYVCVSDPAEAAEGEARCTSVVNPWEETWTHEPGRAWITREQDEGIQFGRPDATWHIVAHDVDPERAALMAAAPELYRALAAVEWTEFRNAAGNLRHVACPECDGYADVPANAWATGVEKGHLADCSLAAALLKARGE